MSVIRKISIALSVIVLSLAFYAEQAQALAFIQFKPMTFNLKALTLKGIFTLKFNRTLMTQSILSCPLVREECEREFKKCAAQLDYFDQAGYMQLQEAKNACVYSCDKPPSNCFGLEIDVPEPPPVPPPSPDFECLGPESLECTDPDGRPGTQTALSCNTNTGEWNYGDCIRSISLTPIAPIEIVEKPLIQLQFICTGPTTRSCTASNGQAGTQQATVCDGVTGQWIWSPCQALGVACTIFGYSDWSLCLNGTQSRTSAFKYPLGCIGEAPGPFTQTCQSLLNTCTAFTYGPWGTCQGGMQTRSVLTRSPVGCTGGSPLTSQSCLLCQGTAPACPVGWSGSYTCMPVSGGGLWMNTCEPPGAFYCYRGVKYKIFERNVWAKCVGSKNAQNCMLNDCGEYQPYNNYNSENIFKDYVDAMYTQSIPNSCNPSFVYTQC